MTGVRIIKPQKGPQEKFLSTSADIAIYGGAAGGGKSYALLMEPLRYKDVAGYKAVIFRHEYMQIVSAGGLWEESQKLYSLIKGASYGNTPKKRWNFGGKASLFFDYITRDEEARKWQGTQICFIGFDELTHFTKYQFFYMLSRNRSVCGVKPYIRATTNPDSDSWVAEFIRWWIDEETGYPIKERSGKIRYFIRIGDDIKWGDSRKELIEKYGKHIHDRYVNLEDLIKSVTFIASNVYDNKIMLESNPEYLANLHALSLVERERLLNGNWKIRPVAGMYFKREQTRIVESVPSRIVASGRAWDLAATEITTKDHNPDRTAGCLMARMENGQYIILDMRRVAYNASDVRDLLKNTAKTDVAEYGCRKISIPQDPGQAGKEQAQSYIKELSGYSVKSKPVSGSKISRAEPFAAQWQRGNVLLLKASWNDELINELEGFPEGLHDDQVDACSDAFLMVSKNRVMKINGAILKAGGNT